MKYIETEEKKNFNLEDRFDMVLVESSSKCARFLKGVPTRKTKNDNMDYIQWLARKLTFENFEKGIIYEFSI